MKTPIEYANEIVRLLTDADDVTIDAALKIAEILFTHRACSAIEASYERHK